MADIDSSEIFGTGQTDDAFSQAKSFQSPAGNNASVASSLTSEESLSTSPSPAEQFSQEEPSDLTKFLYDLVPFLKPDPQDPTEIKQQKIQQVARFQALSQEMQQVALQKMQNWEQKKVTRQKEEEAKKVAQQQTQQSSALAPAGRHQGAQVATSTDQLLDQMRNKSSDLTQAVG